MVVEGAAKKSMVVGGKGVGSGGDGSFGGSHGLLGEKFTSVFLQFLETSCEGLS